LSHIRPRTTVISGAALGLLAGAAVYSTVSSSTVATTPTALRASAPVARVPARAAGCGRGQRLEKGDCIIHVVRTVVVAHPVRK
jgi:hypothetical protein